MRVPRFKVAIAYRPIDRKSGSRSSFKVKITPSLCLSCPQQGLASDMISAKPAERLFSCIRLLIVLKSPMQCLFAQKPGGLVPDPFLQRHGTPEFELPCRPGSRGIIFYVLYIAASLKDQRFQSLIAEFLSGPTAGCAGADD